MPTNPDQLAIQGILTEKILENFPLARGIGLTAEQNMLESGAIDSLGLLTVIEIVEESFDVCVNDDEVVMENFGSIKLLSEFVIGKFPPMNGTPKF